LALAPGSVNRDPDEAPIPLLVLSRLI
jgi:hypothetical protein